MNLELYIRAAKLLDRGPLGRQDCGKLCNKRCCRGSTADGMFLYPGEESFYQEVNWAHIEPQVEPVTGHSLSLLVCSGSCPREKRPLACRTFPLLPSITKQGAFELRLDRRGILVCPLVQAESLNLFHPAFLRRAKRAWRLLLKDPKIYEFCFAFSRQWEKMETEPWEKLLK